MLLETAVPGATIFGSEFLGTLILILLGCGVVANNLLPRARATLTPPVPSRLTGDGASA